MKISHSFLLGLSLLSIGLTLPSATIQAQNESSLIESISQVREQAASEVFNKGKTQRVGNDTIGWVTLPDDFKPLTKYQQDIGDQALQFHRNNEEVVVTIERLNAYDRTDIADRYKQSSDLELWAVDLISRANGELGAVQVQTQQESLPFADKVLSIRALYGERLETAREVKYYVFTPKEDPNQAYLVSVISLVIGQDFIDYQVEPIIKSWSLTKE